MAGQLHSNAMMKRESVMKSKRRDLPFTLQPRLSSKNGSLCCFESMVFSSSSSKSVHLNTSPKKRLTTDPNSISMMKLSTPITQNLSSSTTVEKRNIDSMTPPPPQCVIRENALPATSRKSGNIVLLPTRSRNLKTETKLHSTIAPVNTTSTMKTKAIGVVPKLPSSRKTAFSTFRKPTSSGTGTLPMTDLMNQFPELNDDDDDACDFFLSDPATVFGTKKIPNKNRLYNNINDHPNLYSDPTEDDDFYYHHRSTTTPGSTNVKQDASVASAFASRAADPHGPSRSIPFIDFTPIREEDTFSSSDSTTRSRCDSFTDSMSEDDSAYFKMNSNAFPNAILDDKGKLGEEGYYDNEQDMEGFRIATRAATRTAPTATATAATSLDFPDLQVNLNEHDTNRSFSTLSIASLSFSSSSSLINCDDLFSSKLREEEEEGQDRHDAMERGSSLSMLPFRPIHKKASMNLDDTSPFDYPPIVHNGYSSPFDNHKCKDTTMISVNEVIPHDLYLDLCTTSHEDTNHSNCNSPSLLTSTTSTSTSRKFPPFKKRRVSIGVDDITCTTDTTASSTTWTEKTVNKEDAIMNMTMTSASSFSPLPSRSLSTSQQLCFGSYHDHDDYHYLDSTNIKNNNTLHVPTPVYANKSMNAQELYDRNIRFAFESFNTEHISPCTIFSQPQSHCTTPSQPKITVSPKKIMNSIKNKDSRDKDDECDDDDDIFLCTEEFIDDDGNVVQLDSIEIDQEDVLGPPNLHRRKMRNNILFPKI